MNNLLKTEQKLFEEKCEHGVVKKWCFNCRFKESNGMKVEMFNGHHYVRLKDAQTAITNETTRILKGVVGKIENIDVTGGGSGRRLKTQILALLQEGIKGINA